MNQLRTEVKRLLNEGTNGALESIYELIKGYPVSDVTVVLNELVEEKEMIINDTVKKFKQAQAESLKDLFSKIPDESLKNVAATAEVLNDKLVGGVYFIKNEYSGNIKIGYGNDIRKRYEQIQTGFRHLGMEPKLKLIAVVLGFSKYLPHIESLFHEEFKKQRRVGEWFKVSERTVNDFILSNSTEEIDFINGVIFDYSDYESQFFPEVVKDYEVSDLEIKAMLGIKEYKSVFDVLSKENKLSKIVKIIEKSKTSIFDTFYDYNSGKLRKVGIKSLDSETEYDFQGLKISKFDRDYWQSVISQLR